jgi:EF-hand domain pair/EF hand
MFSRRNLLTLSALVGVVAPALAATKTGPVGLFDADNDGTVDLDEAKKAAGALFDKLDTDKDGTLDFKELKGRLTHKEFTAADPDNDGTLSKDEYLAMVEERFKAADPDNDGTVSAAEFKTHAGQSLTKLLS